MNFFSSEIYKLHELVFLFDRVAKEEILNPNSITYNEFLILMMIKQPEACNQQEIADRLNMSKSIVSQRIRSLLEKELIIQSVHKENRRETFPELTEKGSQILEYCFKDMVERSELIFSRLGKERTRFREALDELIQELYGRMESPEEAG